MTSSGTIYLTRFEPVPERPFAEPAHSLSDAAILDLMRERLRETLRDTSIGAGDVLGREPYTHLAVEDGERQHRMVVMARELLLGAGELTVVGFFGQRRDNADPAVLGDVDAELMQELFQHPYVLSYCSLALPDGNWANLVLLQHTEGIEHWRASQKHIRAARELSPQFYRTIRLHNGLLPGGLAGPQLVLHSTKYYDFSSGWWQAIRDFRSDT